MKNSFNILTVVKVLLLGAIAVVGYFLFTLLSENIVAQDEIEVRKTAVIERSKLIKDVVAMYHDEYRAYPKSTKEIVEFAKNGYVVEESDKFDPNNLGKFEEPIIGTDTVWIEKSYYHLAKEAKEKDPNWTNVTLDTIYVRDRFLSDLTEQEIDELCYIPYSNKVEYIINHHMDADSVEYFRCHAPYSAFLNTKEYNQQFWNFIEDRFKYEVKNNDDFSEDDKKKMNALGAHKAITSGQFHIGRTPETTIVVDLDYFGITFGHLEKVSLDGNWEDPRAKK